MLPQTEFIRDKGYEILYLTDEIDEFMLQMIRDYKEKEFKSVSAEDIAVEESADAQEKIKQAEEENKDLLNFIKTSLGDKVTEVKLSPRLKAVSYTHLDVYKRQVQSYIRLSSDAFYISSPYPGSFSSALRRRC